jgi:hypothetical protein
MDIPLWVGLAVVAGILAVVALALFFCSARGGGRRSPDSAGLSGDPDAAGGV